MAASSPLHRDASASRQPSSHSVYCMPATNAALPSHKHEGLVGPLRPWSDRRSCGARPRPRYRLRSSALEPQCAAKIVARGRSARVRLCPWIFQAPTMPSAIGTENKIATRVARRETRSDPVPPYPEPVPDYAKNEGRRPRQNDDVQLQVLMGHTWD